MNPYDHQWQKLTALARQAPDDRDTAAPYGFSTRVAARAATLSAGSPWAFFERFALRGLVVAAGLCVMAVVLNYVTLGERDDEMAMTDSVGEVLDVS